MENALFHGDLVETRRILYTPSNFAKISLNHLQETGILQAQKPHTSKRSNLSSYLFFIVLSGSGILEYDKSTYSLCAGDCVFIDCHKAYSHQTSENLWRLQWVHFYGSAMPMIYDKYTERGGQPCFHPEGLEDFQVILNNIYEIANSGDYIRDMKINEYLGSLLTLIMAESWRPDSQCRNFKKQNLMELRNFLDTHHTEKITLDDLSERFYINKFYLTRIFKEQFGITISNYLLQRRITHAKQLLRFTDKTVEAVGLECGIGAVHYFSRMFKRVEGISPSEYREMW
ncbi:MAG: AraC family transcriptional regulator [Eubacteriales bacterium]|nr:AraC family transcriptional regulator [Eubacteriales bacterium]